MALDDRYVVWLGTDYQSHRAATARLGRTNIELSVLEGEFSDDEIVALYRSLRPASAEISKQVEVTPLAALGYWQRRSEALMLTVPYGLLKFSRPVRENREHEGEWVWQLHRTTAMLDSFSLPFVLGGLEVDSSAVFDDGAGCSEVEVVYVSGADRGHEIRLIAQEQGKGRLSFPPARDDHPCDQERLRIGAMELDLAWVDPRYGPFDAMWRDEAAGLEMKLQSSAGTELSREWFVSAVEQLTRPNLG